MRTSRLPYLAAASAIALLATIPASAQEPTPPKLERLEEGEQPAITIRQPTTASEITETRGPGGEIKEIKVKSGGSTYYLRPRQAAGNYPSENISLPQWVIIEFDTGVPKKEQDRPIPQRLEPAKPAADK